MANFNETRPEASFINASPSMISIFSFSILPLPTIPLRATASVGDRTAANAKAAGNSTFGSIQ